jgi:hypothetical protein
MKNLLTVWAIVLSIGFGLSISGTLARKVDMGTDAARFLISIRRTKGAVAIN